MRYELPYEPIPYGDGNSSRAVALVPGFPGRPEQLAEAGERLASNGYDAFVYPYDASVLTAGEPEPLLRLIDACSNDFLDRTTDSAEERYYGGPSLGGAIAVGMQKADKNPAYGMLAATGVDAANLVMNNRPFRLGVRIIQRTDTRKAFEANGYDQDRLAEAWQELQIPPTTPFTIVYGGLDYIVRRRELEANIANWKRKNPHIRDECIPTLGHGGMISFFNRNVIPLLETAPAVATHSEAAESLALRGLRMRTETPGA